jgi:hypothetical protein
MALAIQQAARLAFYLSALAFSLFLMFFLSVGLTEPLADFVKVMNAGKHTISEWITFSGGALFCSFFYAGLWTFFKYAEKRSVEAYISLTATNEPLKNHANEPAVTIERIVYRSRRCTGCYRCKCK